MKLPSKRTKNLGFLPPGENQVRGLPEGLPKAQETPAAGGSVMCPQVLMHTHIQNTAQLGSLMVLNPLYCVQL